MIENVVDVPTEQAELRLQIDESRAALTEKLELLEEKVADTVQSATASVAEATATVVETVHNATASVSETVDSVNAAVQGTVESVRHTVADTVESVRGTFDFSHHVQNNPWAMLAGAVALGYVGGRFLSPDAKSQTIQRLKSGRDFAQRDVAIAAAYVPTTDSGTSIPQFDKPSNQESASDGAVVKSPWFHYLNDTFGSEIAKLQSLAIGVSLGLIRDAITDAAPPALRDQIVEVVDGFTEKLGGECLPVAVVAQDSARGKNAH